MQGKATFFKHPIHPILVPFPIAFFAGSVVADVIFFFTTRDYWTRVASTLIGFGLVASVVAAIFGYLDYSSALMSPRAKQMATTHMYLNLGVTVLFFIDFLLRRRNPEAPLAYLLSLVGIVGLAISVWLGGVLVFEERVGVAEDVPSLGPRPSPPPGPSIR
ncbi:MAG: DUF2231 domain-containing protein [Armatimonadota bacterium]